MLSHVQHCNPLNCGPPGSSVHGILQARILEWVAMPSSRGLSQSRDWTQVSRLTGGFITVWAPRETLQHTSHFLLILNNQHDAIKIMYWWDVLWDFQAVQISSEYIITEGRKVNTALRQKLKCILLSVPQECELFLILSSNWNRQEFIHRIDSYVPQARSLVNMLHQLYNV